MNARGIALTLLAFATLGVLATPPALARNRGETVAGWHFFQGGSGDGGYVARMSRRGRGYRFSYFYEFWRGNGGVAVGATFARGACRSGDAGSIVPFAEGMTRAYLDARLRDYLRECPLPRAEAVALRRGLDSAWPRFVAAARRARAAMDRENALIARGGQP